MLECHFFLELPGLPGLSGRSPEIVPKIVPNGVSGLWELITPDCKVWSQRGLNQTCSPRRDLSNDVSHSQFGGQKEVDSRLLVVGSQTASLTPGPSFAHNLGYRCSNDQCEAIFYIYASRPFQWHQEHLNTRCFGPCCRALNIRESQRTPNPHFFQVLRFTPTLGQSRVATVQVACHISLEISWWGLQLCFKLDGHKKFSPSKVPSVPIWGTLGLPT
jgi:hypothetical protein